MQKQANRMRSIGKGQCLSQDPAIETSEVWREDMIFPFIFKLQMRENDTGVVFKEVTIYKIILDTKFKSSQLSLLHMVNVWRIFDYQLLFASVD